VNSQGLVAVRNPMEKHTSKTFTCRFKRTCATLVFKVGAAAWKIVNRWGNSTITYEVGEYTYGIPTVLYPDGDLRIGRFCSIADNVTVFLGGDHHLDWISLYPFDPKHPSWRQARRGSPCLVSKGDVTIGNDVWIGSGATIMPGVTIGDGAAIGAGSVVTRDVEPYTIIAGNPARPIRKRFSEADIGRLLEIRWWDWPENRIRRSIPVLCSGDVDALEEIARLEDP